MLLSGFIYYMCPYWENFCTRLDLELSKYRYPTNKLKFSCTSISCKCAMFTKEKRGLAKCNNWFSIKKKTGSKQ